MAVKLATPSIHTGQGPENSSKADRATLKAVEDLTVEDLLRNIVKMVSPSAPAAEESSTGVQALLGVDIDGFHYTLVCSPSRQPYRLSPREHEIVRLVAEGLPNKCISDVLEISSWTVATHLRRIFSKLGVNSRAAMVARLLEEGLISKRCERA